MDGDVHRVSAQNRPSFCEPAGQLRLVETLFAYRQHGRPVPWLATAVKENGAAKTITLTLRKDVKFHDNTDFNAEAVKWNLEQHVAVKGPGTEKFQSIDVVNEYTIRINLQPVG